MKTKSFPKVVALLICVFMIATFVGCTSVKGPTGDTQGTQSGSEATKGDSGDPDVLGLQKYDQVVTLNFIRGITATIENQLNKAGETIDDNFYLRQYEEQLGIKVKYDWVVSESEYAERMKIGIASGELADVFFADPVTIYQLVESELIADLTPSYQKYASTLTRSILESNDALLGKYTFDGKLYAMPSFGSSEGTCQYLHLREDWRNNLGLPVPETTDDMLQILRAFTKDDPDGNNASDTWGLNVHKNVANALEGFFACFGSYPLQWVDDSNGNLVNGSLQPEAKEVLVILNKLYDENVINKEFVTKTPAKATEDYVAGRCGMVFMPHWLYNDVLPAYVKEQNIDWESYALPSNDDSPAMTPRRINSGGGYVVNKNVKNPEALIKMFNLYFEKCWGETQEYHMWIDHTLPDGTIVDNYRNISPISAIRENYQKSISESLLKYFVTNKAEDLIPDAASYMNMINGFQGGNPQHWNVYKMYGEQGDINRVLNGVYYKSNLFQWDKYMGPLTPTMGEKNTILNDLINEYYTKFIAGDIPIEKFDEFVQRWYDLGGKQITDEVNDWWKNQK